MLLHSATLKLSRWLAPAGRPLYAAIESLVLMLITVALGYWLSADDPLVVYGTFPWALLMPVLVALRYGSLAGVFAMLCMLVTWLVLREVGVYRAESFPETVMLGGFITTLLAGEFADLWHVRLMRAESSAGYSLDRLQTLTQRYILQRLSHNRLEENLLIQPHTLRNALLRLRNVGLAQSSAEIDVPGAQSLLNLLAEYCQLQRAGLYSINNGVVAETPVASLGAAVPLDESNDLLRYAIEQKHLAHIQQDEHKDSYHGGYIVCAPMVGPTGNVSGVLVVERLPLLALHHENLQLLWILMTLYADIADSGTVYQKLLLRWPTMPFEFARELTALTRLRGKAGIDTTLMLFVGDGTPQAAGVLEEINKDLRTLDIGWMVDGSTLAILMPMTGTAGLEGFMLRLNETLQQKYLYASLRRAGIRHFHLAVDERPSSDQVTALLELCGD